MHLHAPLKEREQTKQQKAIGTVRWGTRSERTPRSALLPEAPTPICQLTGMRRLKLVSRLPWEEALVSPWPALFGWVRQEHECAPSDSSIKITNDRGWPLSTCKKAWEILHLLCHWILPFSSIPAHSCAWLIKTAWKPRLSLYWLFLLLNQKTPFQNSNPSVSLSL